MRCAIVGSWLADAAGAIAQIDQLLPRTGEAVPILRLDGADAAARSCVGGGCK